MSYPNYSFFEFVRNWAELMDAMNVLEIRLRGSGHVVAADRLLKAVATLRADLEVLSVRTAVRATALLKQSEKHTRVRPDSGGAGGKRLEDSLIAEPVAQDLLPGSIGVNNEDLLDKNVPWWITNEEGSTTLVDEHHVLYGTFEPGGVAPNAVDGGGRVHPLFQPGYGPGTGSGLIKNPTPARRFVLKALGEINAMWQADFGAVRTRFENELTAVIEMGKL